MDHFFFAGRIIKIITHNAEAFKPTGSAEIIRQKIHFIRGHKVMRDSDLAELYAVETKVFNQAVSRNLNRFCKRLYVSAHQGGG